MREFFSLSWLAVRGTEGKVTTTKIATSAKTAPHHQTEMRPGRGGDEVLVEVLRCLCSVLNLIYLSVQARSAVLPRLLVPLIKPYISTILPVVFFDISQVAMSDQNIVCKACRLEIHLQVCCVGNQRSPPEHSQQRIAEANRQSLGEAWVCLTIKTQQE